MSSSYELARNAALADPEQYWAELAEDIVWTKKWDRVLNRDDAPIYRWFDGAECNTCYNALDRHVDEGHGDRLALIFDSAMTGDKRQYTFTELRDEVARVAGMIAGLGVKAGDRVLIYMPMIPEAAMAMLACARIGAVHSVVFGGFAPKELATRIDDATPTVILTASCGLEPGRVIAYKPLVDEAIELADHKPAHVVLLQRPEVTGTLIDSRDHDWRDAVGKAEPADIVAVKATDPLYILYTSGTTGMPKGVVRDNGGHMVALKWSMSNIYGVNPGEVFWAASDVGWVVGHSYIVYGPLLNGATTVMYEGKPVGTPDAGQFWRVLQEAKVKVLFTAPTALRAIKREDPDGALLAQYDLSGFKALFLAGERADPDTIQWCRDKLQVPVIDNWWQTETGWPICSNYLTGWMMPVKPGSPTRPVPGFDVQILDEQGQPVPAGDHGAIAIKLPMPPSCLPTLWQNDARFIEAYLSEYPGYYQTGDAGYLDEDGYLYVMSRTDDVINVAGHRLSTGQMEEIIAAHPDVAECAVFGVKDSLKGQVPLGLVVLKSGADIAVDDLQDKLVADVRDQIGPVAAFKRAHVVSRLPKTRSGKILRGTMRKMADGESWTMPPTIDDPSILAEIQALFDPAS